MYNYIAVNRYGLDETHCFTALNTTVSPFTSEHDAVTTPVNGLLPVPG